MAYTYFITGGNRGIGLAIVEELAKKDNVKVIASARDPAKSTELKKLADSTGKVEIVELDVSSQESIGKLAAQLEKVASDGIDFFIGNAGITIPVAKAIDTTYEQYKHVFDTNCFGNIFVFKTLYPFLLKKNTRKVVFTSSEAGSLTGFLGLSLTAYGGSKAALNFVNKCLAVDHGAEGFTFVVTNPGFVKTDMVMESLSDFDPEEIKKFNMLSTSQSASALVKLYDSIDSSYSGKFYNYDGVESPL